MTDNPNNQTPDANTAPDEPARAWSKGLSLTGAALLFMVLRLLAVSHYDWRRASSIAGTIGLDDASRIVLGTLLADPTVTGIMLAILVPISLSHQYRLGKPSADNAGNLAMLIVVSLFAAVLLITYHLWLMLAIAAALSAALLALQIKGHRDAQGRRFALFIAHRTGLLMILAALVVAAIVHVPWMPLERIETRTGTVTGYVMQNPPGFLKVLTDKDREILIINIGDVRSREELPVNP